MQVHNNLKPIPGESRWVDYDEESACWGIFGVDSGFCYSLELDEQTANDKLKSYDNQ